LIRKLSLLCDISIYDTFGRTEVFVNWGAFWKIDASSCLNIIILRILGYIEYVVNILPSTEWSVPVFCQWSCWWLATLQIQLPHFLWQFFYRLVNVFPWTIWEFKLSILCHVQNDDFTNQGDWNYLNAKLSRANHFGSQICPLSRGSFGIGRHFHCQTLAAPGSVHDVGR
jgi:hypothetical protein